MQSLILVPLVPCWVVSFLCAYSVRCCLYPSEDLEHYACNNVYRPWVNKGERRTRTLQSDVGTSIPHIHHLWSLVVLSPFIVRSNDTYRKGSGEASVHLPSIHQVVGPTMDGCPASPSYNPEKHSGGRCVSPEPQFEFDVCLDPVRRRSTFRQSDVRRYFNHPSVPSYLLTWCS